MFKHSIIVVEDLTIGLSNKRLYNFQMIRLITFLFLFFISTFSIAQEIESGVIAIASNPIKITNAQGEVRIAKTGDKIYLNDTIQTDAKGKTQILLKDQMTISLGPNSQMVVDKFIYDPKEKSKNQLSTKIKQGAFKFISGKIASDNKDAMNVSIPKATIAIRGTAVAGNVDPTGASTIVLLHGAISLTNDTNSVDISKPGYGTQISSSGIINSPTLIPPATIKSITSSTQQQASNTNTSNTSINQVSETNQLFDNVTFNNYTFTSVDAQKIQQIAIKQGQIAASAAFFNLFGIDVSKVDLNYAYYELTPALQAILISLVKDTGFNTQITYPWLSAADLSHVFVTKRVDLGSGPVPSLDINNNPIPLTNTSYDLSIVYYTKDSDGHIVYYTKDSDGHDVLVSNPDLFGDPNLNAFIKSQIQSFTLDQFTISPPTINLNGVREPVGNIYFNLGGSGFNLTNYQDKNTQSANVTTEIVTFDFSHQKVTNTYAINNIPLIDSKGNPTGFVNTSIPEQTQTALFSQIKNLPGSTTLFYLPTSPVADGSALGMFGSINLNNSSNLGASKNNINNAVWGLFGVALTSPTGTTLTSTQQSLGIVNYTPLPTKP